MRVDNDTIKFYSEVTHRDPRRHAAWRPIPGATTTRCLACRAPRPTRTSRPPIASSLVSITPTSTPATKSPKRCSKRSARPIRSSPTPKSARSTTVGAPTGRRFDHAQAAGANFRTRPGGGSTRYTYTTAPNGAGNHRVQLRVRRSGWIVRAVVRSRVGRPPARAHHPAPRHGRRAARRDLARGSLQRRAADLHAERHTQTGESPTVEVKIPAGATDGLRVRVAGKGEQGSSGGSAGDLFLIVSVKAHALFEREGDDLRVKVATPLYTAILGGEVTVPTPKAHQSRPQSATRDGQWAAHAADRARHAARERLGSRRPFRRDHGAVAEEPFAARKRRLRRVGPPALTGASAA